jgi:hypothetical protein
MHSVDPDGPKFYSVVDIGTLKQILRISISDGQHVVRSDGRGVALWSCSNPTYAIWRDPSLTIHVLN